MGNLLQATAVIKGTKPLLWHVFSEASIPLEKQERTGVAGNDPEEWRKTYTATAEGQLYVDPSYVFGSIRDGAKHTKKGRGSIQPLVAATLQVLDDYVLTDRYLPDGVPVSEPPRDPTQPVYLDVRGIKNPATKARGVRYRVAASSGWAMTFTLLWDKTIVSRNEMEAVLTDAGKLSGIGDGRAVGFGRFTVESFEVCDAA